MFFDGKHGVTGMFFFYFYLRTDLNLILRTANETLDFPGLQLFLLPCFSSLRLLKLAGYGLRRQVRNSENAMPGNPMLCFRHQTISLNQF
jgi:hypothetical protein